MISRWLERARSGAIWICGFSLFTIRQFYRQRGLQIAASLAYATLLSIVPLLTVMFAFPGGLPVFADLGETIQSFLFRNFVPAFGETIQEYLGGFSRNASRLTATGLLFLVIIALMLMATIDNAINMIWHVRNRRGRVGRFLVYWAMITLGPLLVGFGLFSTSYLLALPVVSEMDASLGLQRRILSVLPFLTTSVAFSLLYILVPNCHVRQGYALTGGIIAALMFEMAKMGFGVYVRSVPTEAIYGAIAVIPLFLIWIYTSWVIVLLGAHISFCLTEFKLDRDRSGRDGDWWRFEDAFGVVRALWQAQNTGGAVSVPSLPGAGVRLAQYHVNEILDCLERGKWVERTAEGDWILSRDLDTVTLWDLHRIIPRRLPFDGLHGAADGGLRELEQVLRAHRDELARGLNIPVAEILRRGK